MGVQYFKASRTTTETPLLVSAGLRFGVRALARAVEEHPPSGGDGGA